MKTWCKDIKWQLADEITFGHWVIHGHIHVRRSWDICPICRTERPTRENIKALKMLEAKFVKDNDN